MNLHNLPLYYESTKVISLAFVIYKFMTELHIEKINIKDLKKYLVIFYGMGRLILNSTGHKERDTFFLIDPQLELLNNNIIIRKMYLKTQMRKSSNNYKDLKNMLSFVIVILLHIIWGINFQLLLCSKLISN